MKMTFAYTLIDIDLGVYQKMLDKALSEDLREGGIEWLRSALLVIPIWSGASHGTFVKMAQKLGMSISVPGSPRLGLLNTGPQAGIGASSAILEGKDGLHTITYHTSLWHLIYNEYNNANANPMAAGLFARLLTAGPYNFQAIGNSTFISFASSVKLPSVKKSLKLTKHKV